VECVIRGAFPDLKLFGSGYGSGYGYGSGSGYGYGYGSGYGSGDGKKDLGNIVLAIFTSK
jgi:Keratin-associated matrix